MAATGLMPSTPSAAAALLGSGLFTGPAATLYQAILQATTPAEYLGRVAGMSRALSFGLEPVSATLIGFGSRFVSSGLLLLIGGLAAAAIDSSALARAVRVKRTCRFNGGDSGHAEQ
jgi:hypothetical protein